MPTVLATLHPSIPRLVIGAGATLGLGGFLLWIALAHPPEAFGWRLFLLGMGGLALWLGYRMWRTSTVRLILTTETLSDSTGRVLARAEEFHSIDRGVFAFKPSSGFHLRLTVAAPAGWSPGLWWRLGRSLGVGGITAGNEGKYMAEVISMMILERKTAAARKDQDPV